MDLSNGIDKDVKFFGEGTFEKPKIKFYFTQPCPSLGIECGNILPEFGKRPAFQFVDDQFSCDVCDQKFASGADAVRHWQQEKLSQTGELNKVDIPSFEIKAGLESDTFNLDTLSESNETDDEDRSKIAERYLDVNFYEEQNNTMKEEAVLKYEAKSIDEESSKQEPNFGGIEHEGSPINSSESDEDTLNTLESQEDEDNICKKDVDIKMETEDSNVDSFFVGYNEAIMQMQMKIKEGDEEQILDARKQYEDLIVHLGLAKKKPMTDAERKRRWRANLSDEAREQERELNRTRVAASRAELTKYDCTFCDLKGIGRDGLRKHIQRKHTEHNFVLNEHEISQTELVEKPKEYFKEGDEYVCKICNHRAQRRDSLRIHIKRKHEDKVCSMCSFSAKDLASLKEHADSEHGGMLYPCKFCDKNLVSKEGLRRHELHYHCELITEDAQLHYCDKCEYQSYGKYQLKRHIQSVHEGLKQPQQKRRLIAQCEMCDYKCADRSKLAMHMGGKHGVNRSILYCDQCDFTSSYSSSIINHKKVKHDINRESLRCNYCDFVTQSKQSLQMHIDNKHLGIKHNCDECDYAATNAQSLVTHKNGKHLGIKYPCDQCDYKATAPSSLHTHKKAKHQNVRYYCPFCDFSASFKRSVNAHKKRFHGWNSQHTQPVNKVSDIV